MKINSFQSLLFLCLVFLYSCGMETTIDNNTPRKKAIAKMGEVVVIADDEVWESSVGDSIRYYFEGPFPVTPRAEPIYKVRHFNVQDLKAQPLRLELRTYLIVADLSDADSPTTQLVKSDLGAQNLEKFQNDPTFRTSIGRNKWAIGQIVMYLFGDSRDDVAASVGSYFNGFAKKINDHDLKPLAQSTYARGTNNGLTARIRQDYNLDIEIPSDYIIAYDESDENLLWLRKDLSDVEQHLIFRKFPYKDKSQFSVDSLVAYRDAFGSMFEFNEIEGSNLQVNHEDLPVFQYPAQVNGKFSREYRGIWELKTDFVGGPFIDFLILNEEQKEIIYVGGTVMRIGKSKKLFLRQLEYIVKHGKPIK